MHSVPATTELVAPGSGPAATLPVDTISLALLRGFELRVNGERVEIPLASQRVVGFLVLHRRRLARVFVAGHLWADASEERAGAALRTASSGRRLLAGSFPPTLLAGSGDACGVAYCAARTVAPGTTGASGTLGAVVRRSSPSTRPAGLSMCSAAM